MLTKPNIILDRFPYSGPRKFDISLFVARYSDGIEVDGNAKYHLPCSVVGASKLGLAMGLVHDDSLRPFFSFFDTPSRVLKSREFWGHSFVNSYVRVTKIDGTWLRGDGSNGERSRISDRMSFQARGI